MFELFVLLGILFAYNVIINRFLPQKYHLLFSLSLSVFLVWWRVTQSDIPLGEVGVGFSTVISGLIYGAVASAIIALSIAATLLIRPARGFFKDDRAVALDIRQLMYKTLVNIPIGTVLLEEIVFRGVMLTLLLEQTSTVNAVLISSFFFGIWHVLPALANLNANDTLKKLKKGGPLVIAGTVFFTFLAGIGFALLKIWSGSLIAPIMAHYTANSGGLIASWWVQKFKS